MREILCILKKELLHCYRDADIWVFVVLLPLLIFPLALIVGGEIALLCAVPPTITIAIQTADNEALNDLYKSLKDSPHVVVNKVDDLSRVDVEKTDAVVSLKLSKAEKSHNIPGSGSTGAASSISKEMVEVLSRDGPTEIRVCALIAGAVSTAKSEDLARMKISEKNLTAFDIHEKDLHGAVANSAADPKLLACAAVLTIAVYYFLGSAMISPALVLCEEIEKATICTTLLSGVDRGKIVALKLLTIMIIGTFSVITYMAGSGVLVAILAAIIYSATTHLPILPQGFSNPLNTVIFLLNLFLLSAFIAGTNLLCATLVRTVKAAQSILPFPFLLVLLMNVFAFVPEFVLDGKTLFVPFLN